MKKIILFSFFLITNTIFSQGFFDESSIDVDLEVSKRASITFNYERDSFGGGNYSVKQFTPNQPGFISLSPTSFSLSSGSSKNITVVVENPGIRINRTQSVILLLEGFDSSSNVTFSTTFQVNIKSVDTDSDGDGVSDSQDNCPNQAGSVSNNGCPVVTCNLSAPINRISTDVTNSSAKISWNAVSNSSGYQSQYKKSSSSSWTNISSSSSITQKDISNLEPETNYNWRVRTRCSNNNYGSWSSSESFTTLSNCKDNIVIIQSVNSGQTNNRSAKNMVTATNIINSNALANYDAGTTVSLKPGFNAKSGSTFRAYIEGCSAASSKTGKKSSKKYNTPTEENFEKNTLIIYPNPSSGVFYLSTKNSISNYKVVNHLGKTVLSNSTNSNNFQIDLQKYPLGIYFIQLQLESGKIETKKIIKN